MPVKKMCLGNDEAHAVQGDLLRFQNGLCKPHQPRRDIQCFLVPLKLIVIVLPLSLDGEGERDQAMLLHGVHFYVLKENSKAALHTL